MIDIGKKLTPKELERLNRGTNTNRYEEIMAEHALYEQKMDGIINAKPKREVVTVSWPNIEKPTKQRKSRTDKGSTRAKYDASIPMKMRQYIGSANKRGISFELTIEQFNQLCSLRCVYCDTSNRIGIDRKDSSVGYVIDNCQPCCGTCNLMKHRSDEDDFLSHILKIYKHRLR